MIDVAPPRIKQEDNLVPRSHQNRGLLELTARLKRQPRSALVDKSGGTGPTAVIGAILPIVVEPTKRVFLPLVSGGRAVSERQSQSDFDAPGDGGHW